jgi:hypothetical protein
MTMHASSITRRWRLRAYALLISSKGRRGRAGENASDVARALGVTPRRPRRMYGWLARTRRGGWAG